jgi:N-acetylmuramic acid 6-phosphate etherase
VTLRDHARVESPTEARNPRTADIDVLPTLQVLQRINAEDRIVAAAVGEVLPALADAVDATLARYRAGGCIHYFGAGTSGRIAVADAAELPPTYSTAPDRIVAHHAGGTAHVGLAAEDIEDNADAGAADAAALGAGDVAVGLTASGRTPYVEGALRTARRAGALTILISANPGAPLAGYADHHIGVDTGPEAIAGSTRMKAGTAQKLVLNSFSTALMIRDGKVYSNLMVAMTPANAKLRGRVLRILTEATGLDEESCAAALAAAGGDTKVALVRLLTGVEVVAAADALNRTGGGVRAALAALGRRDGTPEGEVP